LGWISAASNETLKTQNISGCQPEDRAADVSGRSEETHNGKNLAEEIGIKSRN
jgi:hypothetical protein